MHLEAYQSAFIGYDARGDVRVIRGQLGFVRVHNRSSKPLARFKHALTTIVLNK